MILGTSLGFAVGCSSSSSGPSPSTPRSSSAVVTPSVTPTPSPSSTPVSANAAAAMKAYLAFARASDAAQRDPQTVDYSALKKLAVDPAYGELTAGLSQFVVLGLVSKGTPPTSRLRVTGENPQAKPSATVTLSDCPTLGENWRPVHADTGVPAKAAPVKAKPPWRIAVTVIYYKSHWVVSHADSDRTATCTP